MPVSSAIGRGQAAGRCRTFHQEVSTMHFLLVNVLHLWSQLHHHVAHFISGVLIDSGVHMDGNG